MSRVAGCTLATAPTADTNTRTHAQPEAGQDVPFEPLMNIKHKEDEMNDVNKKLKQM